MIRILLIFRLIHGVQLAITVPGTAGRLHAANLVPAAVLLVLVVAESSWFVAHLIGNRRRSVRPTDQPPPHRPGRPVVYDLRAAQVELASAVLILLSCVLVLPAGIRLDAMAPVVALTTEQITGAAIGSALGLPMRLLVGGTAAVVASYALVVGLVSPGALGHADVLIGISGFVALAYLIRRGARFLLTLASELSDMGERLSEEEQRRMLTVELHNHLGNTFVMFERLDPSDSPGVARTRSAVLVAAERLNTFVATGRFSEKVPLIAMLHRQVGEAELIGLQVELILAGRLTEVTDAVDAAQVNLLEEALRAILINVPRNAGVHEALLHAGLATETGGTRTGADTVELVVTDEGKGFPPEILRQGVSATRSLAGHAERLARWGGTLTLESVPGCTQVTLRLPVSPAE
ncbi:ATP-binding protein [Pseudofrankia sp. DC12]|uniref:ATP-binding protein n=1 Tax=Pseudofrankia sp. DC12 TaxID=683315 RepID=UPI0012F7C270|nr:ATP-binding protein [Pseudofrankia sp. DC12]